MQTRAGDDPRHVEDAHTPSGQIAPASPSWLGSGNLRVADEWLSSDRGPLWVHAPLITCTHGRGNAARGHHAGLDIECRSFPDGSCDRSFVAVALERRQQCLAVPGIVGVGTHPAVGRSPEFARAGRSPLRQAGCRPRSGARSAPPSRHVRGAQSDAVWPRCVARASAPAAASAVATLAIATGATGSAVASGGAAPTKVSAGCCGAGIEPSTSARHASSNCPSVTMPILIGAPVACLCVSGVRLNIYRYESESRTLLEPGW